MIFHICVDFGFYDVIFILVDEIVLNLFRKKRINPFPKNKENKTPVEVMDGKKEAKEDDTYEIDFITAHLCLKNAALYLQQKR